MLLHTVGEGVDVLTDALGLARLQQGKPQQERSAVMQPYLLLACILGQRVTQRTLASICICIPHKLVIPAVLPRTNLHRLHIALDLWLQFFHIIPFVGDIIKPLLQLGDRNLVCCQYPEHLPQLLNQQVIVSLLDLDLQHTHSNEDSAPGTGHPLE